MAHGMWGWQKLVPSSAFRIPQDHQAVVIMTGWVLVALIGLCYFSFPALVLFGTKSLSAVSRFSFPFHYSCLFFVLKTTRLKMKWTLFEPLRLQGSSWR